MEMHAGNVEALRGPTKSTGGRMNDTARLAASFWNLKALVTRYRRGNRE